MKPELNSSLIAVIVISFLLWTSGVKADGKTINSTTSPTTKTYVPSSLPISSPQTVTSSISSKSAKILWQYPKLVEKLSYIFRTFSSKHSEKKKEILRALLKAIPADYLVKKKLAVAISRLLFDSNQEVRLLAAEFLSRLGPSFFYLYRAALSHREKKVRWAATYALSRLVRHDAETRRALVLMLRDRYFRVKWQAAWGLGNLSQLSNIEFSALARILLRDGEGSARLAAASSLERAGAKAAPIWARCLLEESLSIIRWECFRRLARWAGDFQTMRSFLFKGLERERDPFFAAKMAENLFALVRKFDLDREELRRVLYSLLSHRRQEVRLRGVSLIGWLYRRKGIDFTADLVRLKARDPSPEIRRRAARLLSKLAALNRNGKGR